MKTKISVIAAVISLSMLTTLSFAESDTDNAEKQEIYISDNKLNRVSVEWVSPKRFTDVRQANFSSSKYREYVFGQLEEHLDKLAEDLPQGHKMKFVVIDLDLAGRVEPAHFIGLSNSFDDVRIMRNIDIPRIKFHYEVLDANDQIIKSDDVNLKDMSYLSGISVKSGDRAFYHEKEMLSKWFRQTILAS